VVIYWRYLEFNDFESTKNVDSKFRNVLEFRNFCLQTIFLLSSTAQASPCFLNSSKKHSSGFGSPVVGETYISCGISSLFNVFVTKLQPIFVQRVLEGYIYYDPIFLSAPTHETCLCCAKLADDIRFMPITNLQFFYEVHCKVKVNSM
jgi:hypothetical protein